MAGKTFTATAPPTALPSLDRAPATGRFCRPMKLVAFTSRLSVEVTLAPLPMIAVVWKVSTWMLTEPAMLASALPPATAKAQTM